jgi:asparagine synthetase B (glutamine-hydrolysing)
MESLCIQVIKAALLCSTRRRIWNIPELAFNLNKSSLPDQVIEEGKESSQTGSKIAIMFSGGIDSTLLAAFTAMCLDESQK